MNTTWHLEGEDREDFVRLLDEALASTRASGGPAVADRPATGQLRLMALSAMPAIAAGATAEYQRYVQVRTAARTAPAPGGPSAPPADGGTEEPAGTRATGPATIGEAAGAAEARPAPPEVPVRPAAPDAADVSARAEDGGAGNFPVLPARAGTGTEAGRGAKAGAVAMTTVLLPVLSAVAAVLFLLVGYVTRALVPTDATAGALVTAGWIFALLAAVGVLGAMVGLLLTALRNGGPAGASANGGRDADGQHCSEVGRARDAWHEALLHRGIEPFLREVLTDPATAPHHVPRPGPAEDDRSAAFGRLRPRPRPRTTDPGPTAEAAGPGGD
ncbi:hypothetical protein ACFV3R_01530 [Streptomyces sp. NPDC059740]|uniref:hypothetical protein n=1 Tax=Streptomyces sp. NPDC059740 TaxID=3346926 RepID=UPI0036650F48